MFILNHVSNPASVTRFENPTQAQQPSGKQPMSGWDRQDTQPSGNAWQPAPPDDRGRRSKCSPARPAQPGSGNPARPRPDYGANPARPQPDYGANPARPQPDYGANPARPQPDYGANPARPQPDYGANPARPRPENGGYPAHLSRNNQQPLLRNHSLQADEQSSQSRFMPAHQANSAYDSYSERQPSALTGRRPFT